MDERNVLIAFDGSESAFKAVNYVADQFSGLRDIKVTLLYVIPNIPPQFWDDGHILTAEEKEERQVVIDRWFANQKMVLEPLFEKARRLFAEKGIEGGQIETMVAGDTVTVAEAILEEAKSGRYRTLVLGRHGAVPVLPAGSLRPSCIRGRGWRCASWSRRKTKDKSIISRPFVAFAPLSRSQSSQREEKREKIAAGFRSLPKSGGLLVPPFRRERKK